MKMSGHFALLYLCYGTMAPPEGEYCLEVERMDSASVNVWHSNNSRVRLGSSLEPCLLIEWCIASLLGVGYYMVSTGNSNPLISNHNFHFKI